MTNVMDSAKEMLDFWATTQNKVVENWVDSTRQLQEAAKEGKVMEQATDMYKNWYDNQKNIISEAMEKGKEISSETMPTQVSQLMEQQTTLSKKWIDTMSEMADRQMQMVKMTNTNGQNSLNLQENAAKMQEMMTSSYKTWLDSTTEMMNESKKMMTENPVFKSMQPMQEAFENMTKGAKTYFDAYEMWKPFVNMTNNKNFDVQEYFKMMNMDKLQEMAKNMFSQNPSQFGFANFSQMNEQMNKMVEQYRNTMMQNPMFAPYKDTFEKFSSMMPTDMAKMMNLENFSMENVMSPTFGKEIYERMQKMYAPFYKLMPPSKEKETIKLFSQMQAILLDYQMKTADMNAIIGKTVKETAEEFMTKMFEAAKDGKVSTYNEFYMDWLNTLEDQMITIFKGDEFSKLQGEILALQLDLKTNFNKGMEQVLSPYPVVLNSEIDELAKQVHALKARVRELENSAEAKPVAKATPAKTVTATKKTTTASKKTTK
ncbi:poly(R)-hydroxyalkanoic acid synthase subunit PhaE [Bernardetia sp.]|uniref:poly(R)-hydroxyalkanoic acid synthase subunit PhaE n=1 Tax=Bernardetia sp. TaxID=1937974 RepID=UPI0025C5C225|nr:poly(R)-hydroxyalkanoic acid synthase subunit PhaE [Bernardetia sp.]